jgi:hypothetical protein
MSPVRAADDYTAIRVRMEELRCERQQRFGHDPVVEKSMREPDGIAHVPASIVRRYLADTRRSSSR